MEQRVIKFRAWDGKMMHSDVSPWRWDFVISNSWHKCEKSTGDGILGSGGDTAEFLVPGIRFKSLMQFTGLHDKNGKEIYEGCIISNVDNKSYKFGSIGVVRYESDYGGFIVEGKYSINQHHSNLDCDLAYECEIIGNIFEHPHLLNT